MGRFVTFLSRPVLMRFFEDTPFNNLEQKYFYHYFENYPHRVKTVNTVTVVYKTLNAIVVLFCFVFFT